MSPEQLARLAGTAPSTIYRWERGVTTPRIHEIERFLDAVRANPSERMSLLGLFPAKAVSTRLKGDTPSDWPETSPPQWAAGPGALLAAIRKRNGIAAQLMAQRLRVSTSTISRWEGGNLTIPAERIADIAAELDIWPEELDALRRSSRTALLGAQDGLTIDDCAATLERLVAHHGSWQRCPADLWFAQVEARLWISASSAPAALELLIKAYTWHAEYLLWQGRKREMSLKASQALFLAQKHCKPGSLMRAIALCANARVHMDRTAKWRAGIEFLSPWISVAEARGESATICRDLAEYHVGCGRMDEARALLNRSRRAAEREQDELAFRFADLIEARSYLWSGQPQSAVPLLPLDDAASAGQRLYEVLAWTRAMIDLQSARDAHYWMSEAYCLIDQARLNHLRPLADKLSQRL